MKYPSIILLIALIGLSIGCNREPETLREQAQQAQEQLAEAREEAAERVADAEEDAVEILADARQEAVSHVEDAMKEADETVREAERALDSKLDQLSETKLVAEEPVVVNESPTPSDVSSPREQTTEIRVEGDVEVVEP